MQEIFIFFYYETPRRGDPHKALRASGRRPRPVKVLLVRRGFSFLSGRGAHHEELP